MRYDNNQRVMKPKVGIIFSSSLSHSNESKYLSIYLAGQLLATGYVQSPIYLIPASRTNPNDNNCLSSENLLWVERAGRKAYEIPVGECFTFALYD